MLWMCWPFVELAIWAMCGPPLILVSLKLVTCVVKRNIAAGRGSVGNGAAQLHLGFRKLGRIVEGSQADAV